MSNEVILEPTEFKDVRSGFISKGFRLFDDHASMYCNNMESIPDDDLEFLKLIMETYFYDETLIGIIEYLNENEEAITIGGTTYSYRKIKKIINSKKK